jgi:type IV pilus assembly protein PilO
MSASKPKFWVIGTAVLTVLLVIAAYFLLIGPKRAEAADFRQQTEDTAASNAQLQAKIEQLKVQFAELPQRQAELAAIKQAMPEEAALPTLVRDLDAMASGAGVTLMSLAPGEPVTVGPPAGAAAAPAPAPAAGSEGGATPAPTAAPAPSDLLASIPVSIVVVGDFYESELFLKNLQTDMPRAYLVTNLTVQAEKEAEESGGKPATKNGDVTMTIAGSVFVLKPAASVTAPAAGAAGTPAAGATPAPTATAAPTAGATTAPTAGATATTEPSATATP